MESDREQDSEGRELCQRDILRSVCCTPFGGGGEEQQQVGYGRADSGCLPYGGLVLFQGRKGSDNRLF